MQVKKNEKVYYDARKNARNAIENGKRQKKRKKKRQIMNKKFEKEYI